MLGSVSKTFIPKSASRREVAYGVGMQLPNNRRYKNALCLLPNTSVHFAYGYACPGFQNPKNSYLSIRVAFITRNFQPLKSGLTFLRSY
jgi:hypothetical protein